MIKKIAKNILYSIATLFAIIIALYFIDRDYYTGDQFHYQGESVITQEQAVLIASRHLVGGESIPLYEISEDGLVNIKYDFYGDPDLDFLESKQYSVFDGPIVHRIADDRGFYLALLALLGVFIFMMYCFGKDNKIAKALSDFYWEINHTVPKNTQYNLRFVPQVIDSIKLKQTNGILAIRTWKLNLKDGQLRSLVKDAVWGNRFLHSDEVPEDNNHKGVHSFRLGGIKTDYPQVNNILGIVSLDGDWTEHEDGVIRAERCEILCLIINSRYKRTMAENLSAIYGVPVVLAEKPLVCYQQWLWSKDGIECLSHNAEIIIGGANHGDEGESYPERENIISETCRGANS